MIEVLNLIRFLLFFFFFVSGLFVFGVATYGIYKFDFVLNRAHAAAQCDSFGLVLSIIGLMFLSTSIITTLKMLFILAFVYLTSPVASHLVVQAEFLTNDRLLEECKEVSQ